MEFATIEEVRHHIDIIDRKIVELIAQRSQCVKAAASFKKDTAAVKAPDRVKLVIDKVKQQATDYDLPAEIIESVYRTMIQAFIDYELAQHNQLSKQHSDLSS